MSFRRRSQTVLSQSSTTHIFCWQTLLPVLSRIPLRQILQLSLQPRLPDQLRCFWRRRRNLEKVDGDVDTLLLHVAKEKFDERNSNNGMQIPSENASAVGSTAHLGKPTPRLLRVTEFSLLWGGSMQSGVQMSLRGLLSSSEKALIPASTPVSTRDLSEDAIVV